MILFDWLFLLAVFCLGIVTSYTDILHGKIKNLHLVIGLLLLIILLPAKLFLFAGAISIKYFLLNVLIAITFSVGIWLLGLWTPGDGKLFFVYSVFLAAVFHREVIFLQPALQLLMWVFIPMFFGIVFLSMFRLSFKDIIVGAKNSFDKKLLISVLAVFVINWIFMAKPWLGAAIALSLLVTYFFFRNYGVYVLIVIAFLRLLFDLSIYSRSFLIFFMFIVLAVYLFRFFAGEIIFDVCSYNLKLRELEPGMVPAEIIYKENKKYKKQSRKKTASSKIPEVFEPRPEGLNKEEIKRLRKLTGINELRVFRTIPFAPFMLIGTILFVLVQLKNVSGI